MKRHIDGQLNESVERRNLRRRTQQPGESFNDFLIALRELAKTLGPMQSKEHTEPDHRGNARWRHN